MARLAQGWDFPHSCCEMRKDSGIRMHLEERGTSCSLIYIPSAGTSMTCEFQCPASVRMWVSLQADDLLKQADELLKQMAQGNFKKSAPAEEAQQSMEDPGLGYQLQCDVNGCTIVPVARQDAARTPSSMFLCHCRINCTSLCAAACACAWPDCIYCIGSHVILARGQCHAIKRSSII